MLCNFFFYISNIQRSIIQFLVILFLLLLYLHQHSVMQDLMGLGVSVRDAQLVNASMDMFWLLWMWLGFA